MQFKYWNHIQTYFNGINGQYITTWQRILGTPVPCCKKVIFMSHIICSHNENLYYDRSIKATSDIKYTSSYLEFPSLPLIKYNCYWTNICQSWLWVRHSCCHKITILPPAHTHWVFLGVGLRQVALRNQEQKTNSLVLITETNIIFYTLLSF